MEKGSKLTLIKRKWAELYEFQIKERGLLKKKIIRNKLGHYKKDNSWGQFPRIHNNPIYMT